MHRLLSNLISSCGGRGETSSRPSVRGGGRLWCPSGGSFLGRWWRRRRRREGSVHSPPRPSPSSVPFAPQPLHPAKLARPGLAGSGGEPHTTRLPPAVGGVEVGAEERRAARPSPAQPSPARRADPRRYPAGRLV